MCVCGVWCVCVCVCVCERERERERDREREESIKDKGCERKQQERAMKWNCDWGNQQLRRRSTDERPYIKQG